MAADGQRRKKEQKRKGKTEGLRTRRRKRREPRGGLRWGKTEKAERGLG